MAKREEGLVNLAELNHMLAALNAPVVKREREKARTGESGIGTKTTGRVFEAILGNEHWHQTNPRSRAHPPLAAKQLSITQRGHVVVDDAAAAAAADDDDDPMKGLGFFEVTHAPRVIVRAAPSLTAAVLGARSAGEVVRVKARLSMPHLDQTWVQLAEGFKESKQWARCRSMSRGPAEEMEAWMMVQHQELGILMKQVGGCAQLPQAFLALDQGPKTPSASPFSPSGLQQKDQEPWPRLQSGLVKERDRDTDRDREREDFLVEEHRAHYKVVHAPSIMVRNQPNIISGKIVRALKTGVTVETTLRQGDWLKLKTETETEIDGEEKRCTKKATPHLEHWILLRHPELGVFVERCQKNGSSFYF